MKNKLLLIIFLLVISSIKGQELQISAEPPNWWVGMKSNQLQLMIHSKNISEYDVRIDEPRIKLIKVNNTDNPNYLFIDLEIIEENDPFDFEILFFNSKDSFGFKYPLNKRSRPIDLLSFNSSDVIYLITPDRFSNGDESNDIDSSLLEIKIDRNDGYSRHGGDIKGIIDHLDYIQAMGFTAIWSTPLLINNMESGSYHGYAITNMYEIDPRMGSNDLYKELSIKANEKGVKLIMDVVLNHIGSNHMWMNDLPAKDWINNDAVYRQTSHRRESLHDPYMVKSEDEKFVKGWFVETMPDLNQENEFLATYLIQNSIWWIEFAHLSGFRVDTYSYSDRKFLYDWNKAIQDEYPGFNVVGEEWTLDKSILGLWQKSKTNKDSTIEEIYLNKEHPSNVPALMDFPLQHAIIKALAPKEMFWDDKLLYMYKSLAQDYLLSNPKNMVIFLDNHDMERCFNQLNHDYDYWKMAQAFLLTTRGIPQIYYGTELLFSDSINSGDHGTLRKDFPGGWNNDQYNGFDGKLDSIHYNAQQFLKKLLNWRKNKSVIHYGELFHFPPTFEDELYTIVRSDKETMVLLVLNNDHLEKKIKPIDFLSMVKKVDQKTGLDVINQSEINLSFYQKIKPKSFLLMELDLNE